MESAEQTESLIGAMLDGTLDEEASAEALRSMAARGETADEVWGATRAVMARALPFEAPAGAIDMCGTGGDGKHSYNISTAVAFVTAACGVPVVKHGNRGVSSRSGSSDVLSALGIANTLSTAFWQETLHTHGIAFLFAPQFHPGLARMAPIRKSIGTRTIFNVLGPLCNPAMVRRQLMGVYAAALVPTIGEVMRKRGMECAWVVHGHDGGDELNIAGTSDVAMVDDTVRQAVLSPEDAGLELHASEALAGGSPEENARAMLDLFGGVENAYRDSVLFNAAAALVVAGKTLCLHEGVSLAREAIDSGRSLALVSALREAAYKVSHV